MRLRSDFCSNSKSVRQNLISDGFKNPLITMKMRTEAVKAVRQTRHLILPTAVNSVFGSVKWPLILSEQTSSRGIMNVVVLVV